MASNSKTLTSSVGGSYTLTVTASIDSSGNVTSSATLSSNSSGSSFSQISGCTLKISSESSNSKSVTSLSGGSSTSISNDYTVTGSARTITFTASWSYSGTKSYPPAPGSISVDVEYAGSGSGTASTITATNATVGGNMTVAITGDSAYTHDVYLVIGSYQKKLFTDTITGPHSCTIPTEAQSYFSGATVTATVRCYTFNGNTQVGNTTYCNPTISATSSGISAGDISGNTTTCGVTLNTSPLSGVWLSNASTFRIAWTGMSASLNSTIASITIGFGSETASVADPTTATYAITDTVPESGDNIPFSVTITDSRGFTATTTVTKTLEPYTKPSLSIVVGRCTSAGVLTDKGTYISVTPTYSIDTSLTGNAVYSAIIYCADDPDDPDTFVVKEGSSTPVTSATAYVLSKTGGYSTDRSFKVKVEIIDTVGHNASPVISTVRVYNVGTEPTILDFYNDGTGLAVGKVAEKSDTFEIAMDLDLNTTNMHMSATDDEVFIGDQGNSNNRNGFSVETDSTTTKVYKYVAGESFYMPTIFVDTSTPTSSDGVDGDVWIKYTTS